MLRLRNSPNSNQEAKSLCWTLFVAAWLLFIQGTQTVVFSLQLHLQPASLYRHHDNNRWSYSSPSLISRESSRKNLSCKQESIAVPSSLSTNTALFTMSDSTNNDGTSQQGQQQQQLHQVTKKGVIFDVDGTLADSWKLGFDATQQVLQNHNIDLISEELYHECTRYTTPDRLARHAGYQPGDPEFESVGRKLAQEFDDLYIGMVSKETASFYNGISDLLLRIPEHVYLGALTNAAVNYAHAVLRVNSRPLVPGASNGETSSSNKEEDQMQLYHRFQSIRGANNVPRPKPAPDGLWTVLKDMGGGKNDVLSPQDFVYIGDSPSDGKAALAAGMSFIGVTWGSHSRESLSSVVADADDNNKANNNKDFVSICDTVDELEELLVSYSLLTAKK
ncbi:hypothetical protein ACA910_011131 [Epithemia clementina (nom. ined.)]